MGYVTSTRGYVNGRWGRRVMEWRMASLAVKLMGERIRAVAHAIVAQAGAGRPRHRRGVDVCEAGVVGLLLICGGATSIRVWVCA
jgi:hypothetical protein